MAAPRFALVRFHPKEHDTNFYIKPIEEIRCESVKDEIRTLCPFEAKDINDFSKSDWYWVKWNCDDNCVENHRHHKYYKAMILLLGETREAIKERRKRAKLPKLLPVMDCNSSFSKSSAETGGSDDSYDDDDEYDEVEKESANAKNSKKVEKERTKKIMQSTGSNVLSKLNLSTFLNQRSSIQNVIEKKSCKIGKTNHDKHDQQNLEVADGLDSNEKSVDTSKSKERAKSLAKPKKQHMDEPQPSTSGTVRKQPVDEDVFDPDNFNEDFEDSESSANLHDEDTEEADGRIRLSANRPQNASVSRRPKKKSFCVQEKYTLDVGGRKRYDLLDDNMIYLGLDVEVDIEVWERMEKQSKPTIYIRELADVLWTPELLINRALKVNATRVKIPGYGERVQIEPDRLQLLNELFADYLMRRERYSGTQMACFKGLVKRILRQKIQDLRTTMKREGLWNTDE